MCHGDSPRGGHRTRRSRGDSRRRPRSPVGLSHRPLLPRLSPRVYDPLEGRRAGSRTFGQMATRERLCRQPKLRHVLGGCRPGLVLTSVLEWSDSFLGNLPFFPKCSIKNPRERGNVSRAKADVPKGTGRGTSHRPPP